MKKFYSSAQKSGKSGSFHGRPKGGHSRFPKRHQREIKKFDPSLFIKKVEEQVTAAAYIPKNLFSDFAIDDRIKQNIAHKGYTAPTPIQDQVIPLLLEGT